MANWRINDIITKIKTNYSRRLLLVLVESRKLLDSWELAKIPEQIYICRLILGYMQRSMNQQPLHTTLVCHRTTVLKKCSNCELVAVNECTKNSIWHWISIQVS